MEMTEKEKIELNTLLRGLYDHKIGSIDVVDFVNRMIQEARKDELDKAHPHHLSPFYYKDRVNELKEGLND